MFVWYFSSQTHYAACNIEEVSGDAVALLIDPRYDLDRPLTLHSNRKGKVDSRIESSARISVDDRNTITRYLCNLVNISGGHILWIMKIVRS